jgi:hypothetical protein
MLLWWLKIRRFIAAGYSMALILLLPAIAIPLNLLAKYGSPGSRHRGFLVFEVSEYWLVNFAIYCGIIAAVIGLIATFIRYRYMTYNPTWGLKYSELFKSLGLQRSLAARALKGLSDQAPETGNQTKIVELDDVLDVLDDIGLYVKGEQISPELAHHYFYYWLRGYYQAAKVYIDRRRASEPSRWSHLSFLVRVTRQANSFWGKDELSPERLEAFLDEEILEEDRRRIRSIERAENPSSVLAAKA